MSAILRTIATRLMMERTLRGWSQRELASRAGVNQSAVCRLESGRHAGVDFSTVAQCAYALGLDVTPRVATGDPILTTGEQGAYGELVRTIDEMRRAAGHGGRELSRLCGERRQYWDDAMVRITGPVLDRVNKLAEVYGYRLALVPIKGERDA